ncbi:hypothetical protein [Nonomuraea sp. NPDC050786]|uniref:hypothetical protein n=1 Tax=Nonomuraea sp. NPDC050786 TaxID=3154840 RepID=UPI0033ED1E19
MNEMNEDLFADADEVAPEFFAEFMGVCSVSGMEFEAGALIKADGNGGWIALYCCGGEQ